MSSDNSKGKFDHLLLPKRLAGTAKLTGRSKGHDQTKANKESYKLHSGYLNGKVQRIKEQWETRRGNRVESAPSLPEEVPLLIKIDPSFDLDRLRSSFDFEIVSEQEDGFIIVAAKDFAFTKLLSTIQNFAGSKHGGGAAASLHDLSDEEDQSNRLRRILSDDLYLHWSELDDSATYTVDVAIECLGKVKAPAAVEREEGESAKKFHTRQQKYNEKLKVAYQQWDTLRMERETLFENFVSGYEGKIFSLVDGASIQELPDSFSARIEMRGIGLRDLIINFPFVFEISSPEPFPEPEAPLQGPDGKISSSFTAPDATAPKVCIIDSGIQEEHPIIKNGILTTFSKSYIDNNSPSDVADQVLPSGHGTRVAGAVLFPSLVPRTEVHQLSCWLINQRILNEKNYIPNHLYPPTLLSQIIKLLKSKAEGVKVFCHSINSIPYSTRHMSAWAAAIDLLSFEHDILLVQSAGNLDLDSSHPVRRGIKQHLSSGTEYPAYLLQASSRIANPAQSFAALTVGSVSRDLWTDGILSTFGQNQHALSPFSRTGFGLWECIKPDVVEFGGDLVRNQDASVVAVHKETSPELLRAVNKPGPLFDSDAVGTSFAAPKVAAIAVELQRKYANEPALLFRALIALSARWPKWAQDQIQTSGNEAIRMIGYGVPDIERASVNSPHKVTLHTSGEQRIKAREVQVFQVPVPQEIRSQANEQDILVEVSLSYASRPRRTRRTARGYLGVWLDWKTSNCNESASSFTRRVCKDVESQDKDGDEGFPWTLNLRDDFGTIQGVRRNRGTLQKDWAVVKAHQLPEMFCIAVIGHPGWDSDPEAFAKYALAVSFEAINKDLLIYEQIKVAVDNLEVQVGVPVQS